VVVVCVVRESRDVVCLFFFSSRRRHTRLVSDWSSDVCSSDLQPQIRIAGTLAFKVFRGGRASYSNLRLVGLPCSRRRCPQVRAEIGRASCRGRGEVSAGGGTEEKKTQEDEMRRAAWRIQDVEW